MKKITYDKEGNRREEDMVFEGGDFSASDEGASSPVDFSILVLQQISRINQIASRLGMLHNWGEVALYENAVSQFSILLTSYKDDKFFEDEELRKKRIAEYDRTGMIQLSQMAKEGRKINPYEVLFGYKKFCADGLFANLVSLCSRKNLFPGKRVSLRSKD